jgi:hypothetical protein
MYTFIYMHKHEKKTFKKRKRKKKKKKKKKTTLLLRRSKTALFLSKTNPPSPSLPNRPNPSSRPQTTTPTSQSSSSRPWNPTQALPNTTSCLASGAKMPLTTECLSRSTVSISSTRAQRAEVCRAALKREKRGWRWKRLRGKKLLRRCLVLVAVVVVLLLDLGLRRPD